MKIKNNVMFSKVFNDTFQMFFFLNNLRLCISLTIVFLRIGILDYESDA